ncbi:hypothetical protein HYPBUDRAFT_150067 [Hyphopichia burtonii NRRL Y-1933]|uniref:Uncharacterized protein n=1 Tax=Hyphopichia burtonii NRRL Y-1933 TaxID=984485 RepID=A0A1E4RE72_9ASCO|nr:hypothetical protein HYPBUDRAFT_150067 [Hyphopichia burtonii NRRL Y-1933]ODV65415.1 hypothetical protein HYPBUDRAFT_150067 [Hyphopichia burtonii NRRL Y-1933]
MPIPWEFITGKLAIDRELVLDKRLSEDQVHKLKIEIDNNHLELSSIDLHQLPKSAYFILETLLISANDEEQLLEISKQLIKSLEIPDHQWNWLEHDFDIVSSNYYKIRILRILVEKLHPKSEELAWKLVIALSYHINPNVPWSNNMNSEILKDVLNQNGIQELIEKNILNFVYEDLKPTLLTFQKNLKKSDFSLANPNVSGSGYAVAKTHNKSLLHGGLRPKLGFSGINESINSEDVRKTFKTSSDIRSLSMVWFTIYVSSSKSHYNEYWPLITSFILNVFDDHEALFKVQGCKLLKFLVEKLHPIPGQTHFLVKTGLQDLFIESVKICLSYLPQLTPVEESIFILSNAYPVIYELVSLNDESKETLREFVDIINGNILTSISHIQDRVDEHMVDLNILLIQQIGVIIEFYLKENILVCLSRVNFILSQTITSPFTIDKTKGTQLIDAAIQIQLKILRAVQSLNDPEAMSLILNYRYDFLAAWTILIKRLEKTSYEFDTSNIKIAFQVLKDICKSINKLEELKDDVHKISTHTPQINEIFSI